MTSLEKKERGRGSLAERDRGAVSEHRGTDGLYFRALNILCQVLE